MRGWYLLSKKMNMRVVKCFIRGKMRTATWETVPQRALRDCSKEVVGKVNVKDFGEGGVQCDQALTLQKGFLLVTRS